MTSSTSITYKLFSLIIILYHRYEKKNTNVLLNKPHKKLKSKLFKWLTINNSINRISRFLNLNVHKTKMYKSVFSQNHVLEVH